MRAGRGFEDRDREPGLRVAIVGRTLAERHWPGENALGKALQIVLSTPSEPLIVVGVVDDVKQFGLEGAPTPDLYVPLHQMPPSQAQFLSARMYWVMRTEGSPLDLSERVRDAVYSVDPEVATSGVRSLDHVLAAALGPRRANVRLLEAFGLAALFLCAVGVYAVAAFSAGVRQRELAIRAALGATRRELGGLVVRDELRPLVAGLVLGLPASGLVASQLGPLLFETSPLDPSIYVAVVLVLVTAGLLASYGPARRAGKSDPARLLRS